MFFIGLYLLIALVNRFCLLVAKLMPITPGPNELIPICSGVIGDFLKEQAFPYNSFGKRFFNAANKDCRAAAANVY